MNSNKFVDMSLDKVIKLRRIRGTQVNRPRLGNSQRKNNNLIVKNYQSKNGKFKSSMKPNLKRLNTTYVNKFQKSRKPFNRNTFRKTVPQAIKNRLLAELSNNDARMKIQRKQQMKQGRSLNINQSKNSMRASNVPTKRLGQRKAVKGANFTISIRNNLASKRNLQRQNRKKPNNIKLVEAKFPVVTVLNNRFSPLSVKKPISSSFHVQKLDPDVQMAIAAIQNNPKDMLGTLETFRPSSSRTVITLNDRFSVI